MLMNSSVSYKQVNYTQKWCRVSLNKTGFWSNGNVERAPRCSATQQLGGAYFLVIEHEDLRGSGECDAGISRRGALSDVDAHRLQQRGQEKRIVLCGGIRSCRQNLKHAKTQK